VCKKLNYYLTADRARARRREKYQENKAHELANNREWRANNLEKGLVACRNWSRNNPEKHKAAKREWLKNNLDKNAEAAMRYHASKLKRTPPWLTAKHHAEIRQFYVLSAKLTKDTGVQYSVDHVMPLQGVTSSGLHVPWNLQVITMAENSRKGNRI